MEREYSGMMYRDERIKFVIERKRERGGGGLSAVKRDVLARADFACVEDHAREHQDHKAPCEEVSVRK